MSFSYGDLGGTFFNLMESDEVWGTAATLSSSNMWDYLPLCSVALLK